MTADIRPIKADEAADWRRAVRAGFGNPQTSVEDEDWARDTTQPVERALAAFDGDSIVATLRSFPTDLTVPGGARIGAGALTAVTCRATHRRQGLLTRMITQDLVASADRGEPADVLIASEYPIYGRFGYGPAVQSTTWELDKSKTFFSNQGEGSVEYIDNETLRKEAPAIFERVRSARPGMIGRSDLVWDVAADLRRAPEEKPWAGFRLLCRDADGVPQGWASYTMKEKWDDMVPRNTVRVADLCAATPAAEARLWRFLSELDLVAKVVAGDRPADELVPYLLTDARAARQTYRGDFLWVRPLDVVAALEARSYRVEERVVLEVTDPLDIAGGRYALEVSPHGASCRRTDETADLTLPVRTLGAAYLGGVGLSTLHAAGWLDVHAADALARADTIFAGTVTPWCNTWF